MLSSHRVALLAALLGNGTLIGAQSPTQHATALSWRSGQTLDVAAVDLDRDGHIDLVYLEGGPTPSLRVFYGDADGYLPTRVEERLLGRGVERVSGTGKL